MKYEWIVDDSGWKFIMPNIDDIDIEKYGLGTWDLADYTFGTSNAIVTKFRSSSTFTRLEKLLWRLENVLRLLDWTLFLKNHKILSRFVRTLRSVVFNIAWKISTLVDRKFGY